MAAFRPHDSNPKNPAPFVPSSSSWTVPSAPLTQPAFRFAKAGNSSVPLSFSKPPAPPPLNSFSQRDSARPEAFTSRTVSNEASALTTKDIIETDQVEVEEEEEEEGEFEEEDQLDSTAVPNVSEHVASANSTSERSHRKDPNPLSRINPFPNKLIDPKSREFINAFRLNLDGPSSSLPNPRTSTSSSTPSTRRVNAQGNKPTSLSESRGTSSLVSGSSGLRSRESARLPAAGAPHPASSNAGSTHSPAPTEEMNVAPQTPSVRLSVSRSASRAQLSDQSPAPKKLKSEEADLDDVFSGLKLRLKTNDFELVRQQNEIERQQVELSRREDEITRLTCQIAKLSLEQQTFKSETKKRVLLALENSKAAHDTFTKTAASMKAGYDQMRLDLGTPILAEELRAEVLDLRIAVRDQFFKDEELLLERFEKNKLDVILELRDTLHDANNVTQLLRDQLLTKTGEIFEARDEIASLREHLTRSFGAKEEGISNNAEALNSFTSRYLDLSEKISELGGQYSALMIEHLDLTNRLGEMKKARDEDLDRCNRLSVELEASQKLHSVALSKSKEQEQMLAEMENTLRATRTQNEIDNTKERQETIHRHEEQMRSIQEDCDVAKAKSLELEKLRPRLAASDAKIQELTSALHTLATEAGDTSAAQRLALEQTDMDLASVQDDLNRSKQEVADLARALSAEKNVRSEELNKVKAEYQSSLDISQARLVELEAELQEQDKSNAHLRSQDLLRHEAELQDVQKELQECRSKEVAASAEIGSLQTSFADLEVHAKSISEQLAGYKEHEGTNLEALKSTRDDNHRLTTNLLSQSSEIARLEAHCAGLDNVHMTKIAGIEARQANEIKHACAATFSKCQENFDTELGSKANEVRRMKNKVDDATKKLEKAIVEIAKLKKLLAAPAIAPALPQASAAPVQLRENRTPAPISVPDPEPAHVTMPVPAVVDQPNSPRIASTSAGASLSLSSISAETPDSDPIVDTATYESPPSLKRAQRRKADPPATKSTTATRRRNRSSSHDMPPPQEQTPTPGSLDDIVEEDQELTTISKPRNPPKTTYSAAKKRK